MEEQNEPMTHIFLKPCGCLSCALVDVPHNFGELAKVYRYAEKHGETYQKIPTQQVREMPWKCELHKTKPKEKQQQGKLLPS